MSEILSPQATSQDIRRGYDDPPTNIRGYVVFIVVSLVFTAAVAVVVWYVLIGMERVTQAEYTQEYGNAPIAFARQLSFPEPQLQPSPGHVSIDWQDMKYLKTAHDQSLVDAKEIKFVRDERTDVIRIPDTLVAAVGAVIERQRNSPTTMPAGSGTSGVAVPGPTPGRPVGTTPQEGVTEPGAGQPTTKESQGKESQGKESQGKESPAPGNAEQQK